VIWSRTLGFGRRRYGRLFPTTAGLFVSITVWQCVKAYSRLVVALVLSKLDYCNGVLAKLPASQLNRLQSVLHASVRLIYVARRHDHVKPLYNDFSGCPFLNAWSSNCASWRIVVSTVLVRTTSRVTLWAYPTCVQDKNYAQRLLQLWWFQLHDIPHLAIGLFLLLLLSCGTHCRATSHLLHHFWLFDINWKHFYFVDLMASDCFDMSVFFVLAFYFLVFIF